MVCLVGTLHVGSGNITLNASGSDAYKGNLIVGNWDSFSGSGIGSAIGAAGFVTARRDSSATSDTVLFGGWKGSTEVYQITANGGAYFASGVGIGTGAPSAPLMFGKSVFGEVGSEDFYRIKIQDQGGIENDAGFGQPETNVLGYNARNGHRFYNGQLGESMRIDSNGNVGIGTDTPAEKLSVVGANSGLYLSSQGSETTGYHIRRESTGGYLHFTGDQDKFSGYHFEVFQMVDQLTLKR